MRNSKLRYMFGSRGLAASQVLRQGALIAAVGGIALTSSGCIEDTDCGICDPNKLILESLTGVNYKNEKIHVVQPEAVDPKYFIEDLVECETTEDAMNSGRPGEYCEISPLITWDGIELVFNNLLDPTSVELVRRDPSNPNLFQVYDWKSQILEIRGPITRYNGDYIPGGVAAPERISRRVNLTCIDNLREQGTPFTNETDPLECEKLRNEGGKPLPMKMQTGAIDGQEPTTKAYRGRTDWRSNSCSTPDEGPDTCCTVCDYELSVNVWKYGETADGGKAAPGAGAIACNEADDVFTACADFQPHVNRDDEFAQYVYAMNGDMGPHPMPWYDAVRETHPNDRETVFGPNVEHAPVWCDDDQTCSDAGLDGTQCIGQLDDGTACTQGDDCNDKRCKAEWFAECVVSQDTTGAQGFCVDKRFDSSKGPACYRLTEDILACDPVDPNICSTIPAGAKLAQCDIDANGAFTGDQCCAMGANGVCDPVNQPIVEPVPRFERDTTLPEATRSCVCEPKTGDNTDCHEQIDQYCNEDNQGEYITRFVTKIGGIVYDPAIKGVDYRPGDIGNESRSLIESCAEARGLVGERNIQDGWIAHEGFTPENYENFDRGMCSGQEYELVFATTGEHVRDKVGNKLNDDQLSVTFRTPQFHVVPDSGFPTDNLRIGACDEFELRLSNKFDMDPNNLRKIQIWQLGKGDGSKQWTDEDGDTHRCDDVVNGRDFADETCWEPLFPVAGGVECSNDAQEVLAGGGDVVPCLVVDVADQTFGTVGVSVDAVTFARKLFEEGKADDFGVESTGRYRMVVPGLGYDPTTGTYPADGVPSELTADVTDEQYRAAFHDVCGMPLIVGYDDDDNPNTPGVLVEDFHYDFSIDEPKCRDDKDGDGVQASCDNANKVYNPDQADSDSDTFGDVIDLCPITPGSSNTSDSDKDGVGNDCDNCRKQLNKYNIAEGPDLPDPKYWVRTNWQQIDTDQDGIGDVCDNCVQMANCEDFGPASEGLTPHVVGTEVDDESEVLCQQDANADMIGDDCAGQELPGAAGPVGFGPTDDFDQDGIANQQDICPRQPILSEVACTDDSECTDAECDTVAGLCNHKDTDGDGVGNICDTCPFTANPEQTTDMGMQLDDEDGDGVGAACESASACASTKDPRPLALYEVAVDGFCCVTIYPGDGQYAAEPNEDGTYDCIGLCDPDGLPITKECANEPDDDELFIPDGVNCRRLPDALQAPAVYGVTDLPPGCQDALDAAGKCDPGDPNCPEEMANKRLTSADEPDDAIMWQNLCVLPQRDQDFDGLGDICDKCEYAFDPFNYSYIDENGKFWPDSGRYCNGEYNPDVVCEMEEEAEGETGTDESGDTGDTGDTTG